VALLSGWRSGKYFETDGVSMSNQKRISLSAIITALHETWSLKETVDKIVEENGEYLEQVIIVVARHSSPECLAVIGTLKETYGEIIHKHEQTLPYVGGAIIDSIGLVKSPCVVMLAADLETDPALVKTMYHTMVARDLDVVATSRWLRAGCFSGYHPLKRILNRCFQRFFSALYGTDLTDMTYGYRMYKTELLSNIEFSEYRHAFFLESLVKPLKAGARIEEISAHWKAREEGESVLHLTDYIDYFKTGFLVWLRPSRGWLKDGGVKRAES
jgi:hypothetical protein